MQRLAIARAPRVRPWTGRLLRRALEALGDPFLGEHLWRGWGRAGRPAAGVGDGSRTEAIAAALARLAAGGPSPLRPAAPPPRPARGGTAPYSPQPSRRRASRAARSCANSSSSCWRPARDIETSVSWSWRNGHIASSWSMLWRRNRSASVRAR